MEERSSIKDKIKKLFSDDKKRPIIILIIVIIILASIILACLLVNQKVKKSNEPTTTRITTTKKVNIFKGYDTKEINLDNSVSYDVTKNYEFIYAQGSDDKTIYTFKDDLELLYELSLEQGAIIFKEQRYNNELNAYEYTSKTYTYKGDYSITDYIVATTCEQDSYSIVAIDEKKNIYIFNSLADEFNIKDILANFTKTKTISPAKKLVTIMKIIIPIIPAVIMNLSISITLTMLDFYQIRINFF